MTIHRSGRGKRAEKQSDALETMLGEHMAIWIIEVLPSTPNAR